MDVIQKVLYGVEDFPTLPTIYTALTSVLENANSTPADASNVISRDQSAAMKILKVANSSMYGFRGRIDSVTQAIFYIGFEEVRNLIIAISILDIFKKTSLNENFNPVDLWKHSIATGIISRQLGFYIKARNLENFFIAGIIHDIGKLLFVRNLAEEYNKAIIHAIDKQISIRDSEAELMGITHTVAGELIAEKWKLPSSIKNAIRHHHTGSSDGSPDILTACVHIANTAARMFGLGESGDAIIPEPNVSIWKILNLPQDFFTQVYPRIIHDYEEAIKLFSLF